MNAHLASIVTADRGGREEMRRKREKIAGNYRRTAPMKKTYV